MKKFLILLISFFIIVSVNAQKNFQGEITYRLHASNEDKGDAELKILFGVNKLKLRFKEKEEYEKEDLLVLLDSAAMFTVNKETKTYTKKPLHVNTPASKQFSKKSFAGYSSTPLIQENNGLGNILGGLMGTSDIVFYLADSLYYNIPAAFIGNQELIAIQKNKIVLGAEINIKNPYNDSEDSSSKKANLITVEAIEIIPMIINESEFSIPADYVDRKSTSYTTAEDSVAVSAPEVDTVLAPSQPARKPVPKKPVKSNKPKTVVKSSAIKRKE